VRLKSAMVIVFSFVLLVGAIATKPIESTSPPSTKVFIDPASIIDLTQVAGKAFTIRLNISNVVDLNIWQAKVRFNPLLLYTNESMIVEGPFLKQGGSTYFAASLIEDYVIVGACLTEIGSVSGSGVLATITFKVMALGECNLNLFDIELFTLDDNNIPTVPIPYQEDNGYFRNVESTRIPVAKFAYSAQGYNVTFNASTSFDTDGTLSDYVWFWGGSSLDPIRNSTTKNPIIFHQYQPVMSPPQEENATVRLIVVDNDGIISNINVKSIKFGIPVHDIAVINVIASPHNVVVGQNVNISVAVGNKGNQIESFNLTIYQNVTEVNYQNITNTQWETIQTERVTGLAGFEERNLSFIISTIGFSLGKHVIKAETDILQNETDTSNNFLLGSFTLFETLYPPVAKFLYSPNAPQVGEAVIFDASQGFDPDGEVIEYRWNFGDDNLTVVSNPVLVHVYGSHGTYNVTLTLVDGDGLSGATWQLIKVYTKPLADFTYTPQTPFVNVPIAFDASASYDNDGNITSYIWDFDDGNTTTVSNYTISHVYVAPGNYTVTLTVTDNDGLSGIQTRIVSVREPLQPNMLPYLAIAVAIIVIVPLLLFYFLRRKRY